MTALVAKTEVWLVDLDACAEALDQAETAGARLTADDRARAAAVWDPEVRSRRMSAAIALRLVLERTFGRAVRGVPLARGRLGRPELPDGIPGSFSVSHSGGFALIGVTTGGRIGVDLELLRPVRMSDRRRLVIEAAGETLAGQQLQADGGSSEQSGEYPGRFLQAWVLLEALAKADGRGIGHLLTQLGAVGGRKGQPDAAAVMAGELGVTVHRLAIGAGRFAGIACGATARAVLPFPASPEGIADMIAG